MASSGSVGGSSIIFPTIISASGTAADEVRAAAITKGSGCCSFSTGMNILFGLRGIFIPLWGVSTRTTLVAERRATWSDTRPKSSLKRPSLWADITIAWALLESAVFTMALAISSTLGGLDCGSTFEYSYLTESSFAKASISRLNCSAKACSSSSPSSTWVTMTFEPEYSAR